MRRDNKSANRNDKLDLEVNSSLDKLAKNLSDSDFKYLSEEFSGEKLELVKKKGIYPYEYLVLKNLKKVTYLILINFVVH